MRDVWQVPRAESGRTVGRESLNLAQFGKAWRMRTPLSTMIITTAGRQMSRVLSNLWTALLVLAVLYLGERSLQARQASVTQTAPDELGQTDTLVVCPRELQADLQRWIDYRESQGHRLAVVDSAPSAFALKQLIRERARQDQIKNLVLVGTARGPKPLVPVDLRLAQVNFFFGSELDIATDNSYADIDQDGLPDLALGRIPVSSPTELRQYIDRVIAYELDQPQTTWRRRINVVAGVGGFGGVADKTIENTVKILLGEHVPPGYDVSVTYGSWTSPYCPDPRQFSRVSLERFNEGCLFWVYVGHGSRHRLDTIRTPLGRYPVMDLPLTSLVAPREGRPIALFLACHTGAFDDPRTSLAETLLLRDKGPIAVISGTRVTMPTAMGLLALGLLDQQFGSDTNTVGEMLRQAKLQMLRPGGSVELAEVREMIVGLNFLLSPRPDMLGQELSEHVHLFHLLGDPLLRVQRPAPLELNLTAGTMLPGGLLEVRGSAPFAGELSLELCYSRDRIRERPLVRDRSKLTPAGMLELQADYEQAQDEICLQRKVRVEAGNFIQELKLPADLEGAVIVRGFLKAEQAIAVGGVRGEIMGPSVRRSAETSPAERLGDRDDPGRSK